MTRSSLPSARRVPAPTGVKNPAIPAPAARMASANVPCGTSVASMSPALTAATASGFEVKYDAMPRLIRPWRSSFPSPRPGSPMLFETIVSSSASELSTSASMSVSGAPTSPNPPTITVSPDRIADTASSGATGPFAMDIPQCLSSETRESLQRLYAKADLRHSARRLLDAARRVLYTCGNVLATRSSSRWGVRGPRLAQLSERCVVRGLEVGGRPTEGGTS